MTTPAGILTALKTLLEDSSDLSYVKDTEIFLGLREAYNVFPCIVIEKTRSDEQRDDVNGKAKIFMRVVVFGINRITDVDQQLVGSGGLKGTADMENDIKKAISADKTLGGTVIDINFGASVDNTEGWPTRGIGVEIEIEFRQTETTRT